MTDASALVQLLVDDGPSGELARQAVRADPDLFAPGHAWAEVTNTLARLVRKQLLSLSRAEAAIADLQDLSMTEMDGRLVIHRAWQLRDNLTLYDGPYVAVAEMYGAQLLTADAGMATAARALGVRVLFIG